LSQLVDTYLFVRRSAVGTGSSTSSTSAAARAATRTVVLASTLGRRGASESFAFTLEARMLVTEFLKFPVDLGHFVRAIMLVVPDLERLASPEDQVDAAVVFKSSWIFRQLAKKGSLDCRYDVSNERLED
jgi:hypothetical protein